MKQNKMKEQRTPSSGWRGSYCLRSGSKAWDPKLGDACMKLDLPSFEINCSFCCEVRKRSPAPFHPSRNFTPRRRWGGPVPHRPLGWRGSHPDWSSSMLSQLEENSNQSHLATSENSSQPNSRSVSKILRSAIRDLTTTRKLRHGRW